MTTTFIQLRRMPQPHARQLQWGWVTITLFAAFLLLTLLYPDQAFAQDARTKVAAAGQKAFDLVFSVVYWICGIAVVVSGLAATFGRMEWGRFGQIIAGIVVVFGATAIVDYFK